MTLDHLVYAVPDLEEARQRFHKQWGLHVVAGGSHPQWGTHNCLSYFGLPYVEFIAVQDPAVAMQSNFGRMVLERARAGGGLTTFALGTAELDGAVARLRAQGVAVEGPIEGRRTRPDGSVLAWRLAFPEPAGGLRMPFLIQWQQSDEARKADLTARGAIAPHAAGDVRLGLVVAVRNLGGALDAFARYFGISSGPIYADTALGGRRSQLNLKRGDVTLWETESVPEGPHQVRLNFANGVLRPLP